MSGSEAHDEDEQQRSKRALRARNAVNYSEDSIRWENIVLEEEYTDSIRPTKKIKVGGPGDAPAAVFADNQLEEETAWAVGLNAKAISEEEEDLLPPGADEAAYTRIRNWVLSRWREDVSRYLPEEEAQDGVPHKHREYALAAWRFLNAAGYINFGIAPHLLERAEQTPQDRGTVIVVGAGLSGMAAARQLRAFGFKVVVVEGHARPGGRVYSKRLEGQGLHAVADMGGSVITGIDGNPLAILAKQLQIPLHLINTQQVPLHVEDGSEANKAIDDQTEAKYNTLLDTCSQARDDMGDIADHISLGTALETLWRDLARRASHRAATTSQPAEPAKPRKRGRPAKRPVGAAKSNVGLPAISDADLVVSELRDNDAAPSARDTPAPMAVDVTAPSKLPGTVIDLTAQSGSVPSDSTAAQAHPRKGLTAAGDAELDGDTAQKEQSAAKLERRLLDWHFANLEFANAAVLHTLSMRNWDQDDPYELQGGHCFLPGGNLRLVAGLAKGLPIFYNSPVQEIRYCQSGVVVQTPTHALKGDAVVVSVPLGVLKKGSITFTPPLPQRKQETIQRLGFGVLNKVVLLFPYVFWQTTLDMFGRVAETTSERGEFFLFYSYAHIAGGPLLIALVSGEAAERFEQVPAAASVAKVMATLRAIFGRKGVQVPPPVQACCTRWGQDPMAYGSYSSIAVGALGGEDYDVLAENIGGRVFFAGEATTRKYPATMHGAFFTGLREAANVSATFAARAATAKRQSAEAAKQAAKPATQEQAAAAREARQQRELDKAAQAQTLAQLSRQLVQVFVSKEFPCDAEFGCFALVYGPEGSEFSEEALVRLDIGDTQGRSRRAMPMFFTLAREDAIRLRDMAGDEARINFLVYSLGVKLQYPAAEQPPYQPAAGLQYFSGDSYASAQPYPPASLDTQPTQAYPPDSYGRDFYAAPQAGSVQPRGAASYHIDSVRPGQRGVWYCGANMIQ
ncbi:hypothetical protein WJX72_010741 [[Myrmecia] bisecta]|uniref:SWIRM domain-containing protein n=1 Tax=[Myrmecia] bisecta TaxID=41462 RepID=A0AAW1PXS3_9CHLO